MKRAMLFAIGAAATACGSDRRESSPADAGKAPDAGLIHVDRSHLGDMGTSPLDFSDPALWLCRPGIEPNECEIDLDSTELTKDLKTRVVHEARAEAPPFDCFYVYPTVDTTGVGNTTDFRDIGIILDPLVNQAARFTRLCEVYAPLYRQVSLAFGQAPAAADGDASTFPSGTGDSALAAADVASSFEYYLDHWNHGRKFVLLGHSQGTGMLTQLVQKRIDHDPALRAKMISALLIGGFISVPPGKQVGGTFQNVPLCTENGQTGCVVAYNSFATEAPPPENSLFARDPNGLRNACTDPALLAGNTGAYRGSYSPSSFHNPIFKPDVPATPVENSGTPFSLERERFEGKCVSVGGFTYLAIEPGQSADDQRPVPPYRNTPSEAIGFGMHIADYAIEQDDLIDLVANQAEAAL